MRSFPNLLNKVISEEFHFPLVEGDKNTLRLIEEKENLSVEIKINNSDNISCFSFDKDKESKSDSVFPFLNSNVTGLCTKNDFILVHQKGNQIFIFLIELKSTNNGKYLKQLRAGKLFFQFIVDRMKLASVDWQDFDLQELEKLNLHYKGILFKVRKTVNRETSRHKKLEFNKTPDLDVCILNYDNVYYLSQFV